jgi:L-threonylcarbamoyladenylate synthase
VIKTKILSILDENAVEEASQAIRNGSVIIIPTDTVYGIAASAFAKLAIKRIYEIKSRGEDKALPIIISDFKGLLTVADNPSPKARKIAQMFWPGALTIIFKKKAEILDGFSFNETVGVRVPNSEFVRKIADLSGPLAVTSANISGMPPTLTANEALKYFENKVDLILDGGEMKEGIPSTVVDCTQEIPNILSKNNQRSPFGKQALVSGCGIIVCF